MLLLKSADFFKIDFFKIFFQEHYQSVKQFGSRSGPTSVGPDLAPKCFKGYLQTTNVTDSSEKVKVQTVKRVAYIFQNGSAVAQW